MSEPRRHFRRHCCTGLFALVSVWLPACDDAGSGGVPDPATTRFKQKDVAFWADRLIAPDRATRRGASKEIVAGGEAALPLLGALLQHTNSDVRKRADALLRQVGAPAVPLLMRLARHEHWDTRLRAISVLGDLGPDAEPAARVLAAALKDNDDGVAAEAAWAIAALREKAAPVVDDVAAALTHRDVLVRITVAGTLATLGPKAASATEALTQALDDEDMSVRRCAADALAAIGPPAAAAVPRLIAALEDENLYVRVCAAGALGGIGPAAKDALPALHEARKDPGLQAEVHWALARIAGRTPTTRPVRVPASAPLPTPATQPARDEWPMLGGSPSRNAVSPVTGLPESWDVGKGSNIRWSARLGNMAYGSPVVAGGMVFVGTDNGVPRNPAIAEARGVLMAFRAEDGAFVWQDTAAMLGRGLDEFLLPATTSTPLVEGDRLYYMTAQCQLRCLDTAGFTDGENDGPLQTEPDPSAQSADWIWELDIGANLGVFPHEAPNCSVVAIGDVLLVCTSNGVDEAHTNVPAPRAPSFIGVDKRSGEVVWQVVGPGENILHGQWSSPAVGRFGARVLAFFGGGDGWLYALDPRTGGEAWRYDGNPKDAVWRPSADIEGITFRNSIVACPLFHAGRVYLTMGQDPEHGPGKGRLHAIDPAGHGDVTTKRRVWEYTDVGRAIGTPAIHDGLLYLADYNGFVHCVDVATGRRVWMHDLLAPLWGAMLIADGKLYVGDEEGTVTIFRTGRTKEIVAQVEMNAAIYSAPAAVDGVLYIATSRDLFAIADLGGRAEGE